MGRTSDPHRSKKVRLERTSRGIPSTADSALTQHVSVKIHLNAEAERAAAAGDPAMEKVNDPTAPIIVSLEILSAMGSPGISANISFLRR
jgi:hypothetical protein